MSEKPHGSISRSRPARGSKQKNISLYDSLKEFVNSDESEKARNKAADDGESTKTEELHKKVQDILNKLTPINFGTSVKQVKDLGINTEERLIGVVDLIFEKSISEPNFIVPYANLCKQLAMMKVPLNKGEEHVNFRKLLLTKCQREFEQDRSDEINRAKKKKQIEECKTEEKAKQLQEKYEEEEQKNSSRQLGNTKFIGELFNLGMLIEPIMHECVKKLLSQGDEDSLECLCCLLTTIGRELVSKKKRESNEEYEQKKDMMNSYMAQMQRIVDKQKTSSRVRSILQDVIALKKRNWVPRKDEKNPKNINQIHEETEKEAQEQQQMLQNMSFPKGPSDDRQKNATSDPCSTSVLSGGELSKDNIEKKFAPIIDESIHSSD